MTCRDMLLALPEPYTLYPLLEGYRGQLCECAGLSDALLFFAALSLSLSLYFPPSASLFFLLSSFRVSRGRRKECLLKAVSVRVQAMPALAVSALAVSLSVRTRHRHRRPRKRNATCSSISRPYTTTTVGRVLAMSWRRRWLYLMRVCL